jgi:histidinol dehydrogenase
MRELSYKDTEREIEVKIFDLEFKISNKIEKINTEEIQKQAETDEKIIEKIIDDILGENATKKINEKRVQDGYEVMSLDVQTQVLNWIIRQYTEEVLKPVENTVNNIQKYSNDYRRNRKFNNRYRRY